jgi:hypothetical protein
MALQLNLISFTALAGPDECYFLCPTTKEKFYKKFKFTLEEYPGDIDKVYDWVKKNATFVGYTMCCT